MRDYLFVADTESVVFLLLVLLVVLDVRVSCLADNGAKGRNCLALLDHSVTERNVTVLKSASGLYDSLRAYL